MNVLRYLHNKKRKVRSKSPSINEISRPSSVKKRFHLSRHQISTDLEIFSSPECASKQSECEGNKSENGACSIELFSSQELAKTPRNPPLDFLIDEEECCPETPPSQLRSNNIEIFESPFSTPSDLKVNPFSKLK